MGVWQQLDRDISEESLRSAIVEARSCIAFSASGITISSFSMYFFIFNMVLARQQIKLLWRGRPKRCILRIGT